METEVQGGKVIYPKMHSSEVTRAGFELRLPIYSDRWLEWELTKDWEAAGKREREELWWRETGQATNQ